MTGAVFSSFLFPVFQLYNARVPQKRETDERYHAEYPREHIRDVDSEGAGKSGDDADGAADDQRDRPQNVSGFLFHDDASVSFLRKAPELPSRRAVRLPASSARCRVR